MAQPLFTLSTIPKKIYRHTKWAVPKKPLRVMKEGQEIDYSDMIEMEQGGGLHVEWHNESNCKHEDHA